MSKGRVLSTDEFKALQARLKAALPAPELTISKARTTVNRPAPVLGLGVSKAVILKADPLDNAQHTVKVDPNKVMAMDLSMAKTGLAWGTPGQLPQGTLCLCVGREFKNATEGERLHSTAKAIAWNVSSKGCGLAIFSEFYSSKFMLSFRASAALRGAVMAECARHGIEARAIPEISARSAAGVDLSKRREGEKKDGWMKGRARARLEELGIGYLQEDEGDAALLLLGSAGLLGIEVRVEGQTEKYDLSLLK